MGVIACSVAQSKSLHLASESAHTYYQTTFSLLPLLLFAQLFYYSQVVSRDAALSTGNPEGPRLARVDNWAVYMGPAERSEGETTSERETRGMYEKKKKGKDIEMPVVFLHIILSPTSSDPNPANRSWP